MNGLALCSGIGCIDLGLRIATGGRYRVVCHVEREAYPAAALVARMEDKAMDRAPIWNDIATFDGRPWCGLVDVITAGLPCQPYSLAGLRLGNDDERALWPHFVRILEETEAGGFILENTPDFLRHFGPVWAELRRLGFECAPPLLQTASESGAIHIRERLFIAGAHPDRTSLWPECWRGQCWTGSPEPGADDQPDSDAARDRQPAEQAPAQHEGWRVAERNRRDATDADSEGLQGYAGHEHGSTGRQGRSPRPPAAGRGPVTDIDGNGLALEWSGWIFDSERQTFRHDTDRCDLRCRICGSPWETESPVVRVGDGIAGRMVELRATGNGVVPLMAAKAWRELLGYLTVRDQ